MLKYLLIVILLFIINSCTSNTEIVIQDEVSINLRKWKNKNFSNYQFTFQISCYCVENYTLPKQVVIKNNKIFSVGGVFYAEVNDPSFKTVEGYFKYIRNKQSKNPVQESLNFDPIMGYPTYIYFDISEMIADEEIGYTISNLIQL